MPTDCELVIQLAHHILHGGYGEGKLAKFHYKLAFDFFNVFSAIVPWPQGEKFPFLLLLRMKGRIETMQNLHNIIKQAGAELCQAQVKLEVIVYVEEEAWS